MYESISELKSDKMASAKTNSSSQPCKEINHTPKSSHFDAIFKRFHEMKSNMELCDVSLKAANVTFSAHRLVLAGNSPYFRNLFLARNSETRDQEVVLPDNFRSETVRLMLEYFYTGKLRFNEEDCEELLSLACMLQVWYRLINRGLVSDIVATYTYSPFSATEHKK